MDEEKHGLKAPLFASLALAFASFGDAFLYPFLPLNGAAVGVPVVWVGILLSVNRFIRIISNTWMVHLFVRYGLRSITILAVVLALVSTAGYAFASGVLVWLVLRVMWGISFSAMRISTLGYALLPARQGLALGLTRGVQEAGPMIALLMAPLLLQFFSYAEIFMVLTLLSLPAIYFAWELPITNNKAQLPARRIFIRFPSAFNSITFVSAFLIDGVIIVTLGILFVQHSENISLLMVTTLAAAYLGYRRICLVVFSPAGGWIADRIGMRKVFNISFVVLILGLLILISGWVESGAIIVFTVYGIYSSITPAIASQNESYPLAAVAENATWRDIGAALGTLAGGLLLTSSYLTTLLIFAIFILTLLFLSHLSPVRKTLKLVQLWK